MDDSRLFSLCRRLLREGGSPEPLVRMAHKAVVEGRPEKALPIVKCGRRFFRERWEPGGQLIGDFAAAADALADQGETERAALLMDDVVACFGSTPELVAARARHYLAAGWDTAWANDELAPGATNGVAGRRAASARQAPILIIASLIRSAYSAILRLTGPGLEPLEVPFASVTLAVPSARGPARPHAREEHAASVGPLPIGDHFVLVACEILRSGWVRWRLEVSHTEYGPRRLPLRVEQGGRDIGYGVSTTDEHGVVGFTVRPDGGPCEASVGDMRFKLSASKLGPDSRSES